MAGNNSELDKRLWAAADELRANSNLTAAQYSAPVLGLIFLRYADARFIHAQDELEGKATGRRKISRIDYQAKGILYLPEAARFSALVTLPEGAAVGKAIDDGMTAIEAENEDLRGVLPKTYNRLENGVLFELLKIFNSIPMDIEGDAFGKIYEYFLGKFAMSEGQRGGEFFTPTSLVKLIVEIIEPYHGYILDPACGSGGMFVQSAEFVRHHVVVPAQQAPDPLTQISIYGQERVEETVRLCRMNLAVHGLHGDIRQGNSYYEDVHNAAGRFDFVMANPPFNVNGVDKEKIKDDRQRYPLGMPNPDNGNYLWIQLFYSSLNETGRAGFVMANSASDARQSEQELRRQLIQAGVVDVMVAVGPNFFYNVTLPVTLWFLDKGKKGTPREDQVLFLDARSIFTQVDRAHREFTPEQVQLLASIVRLYRGEDLNGFVFDRANYALPDPQLDAVDKMFVNRQYNDIAGLCKVVNRDDIKAQNWSMNPGRYVGVSEKVEDEFVFLEQLEQLNEELEILTIEAHELEGRISENVTRLLETDS
jgi:type I restriction enzyme M protein